MTSLKKIFDDNNLSFQEAEFTCGPVTLLNTLRLKGDFSHSENELSKLCKANPKIGTNEENMVEAAKKLGFKIIEKKWKSSIKDIERHIDKNNFVIVCYFHAFSNEGHYGLVTEYDDEAVYLRDCSLGFLRLKKKYLVKHWHGHSKKDRGWLLAFK